jgi:hypothetical protein
MYKLCKNHSLTGQPSICVHRLYDNAYVPFDPANTDYQKYLEWVDEGNTPLPADE